MNNFAGVYSKPFVYLSSMVSYHQPLTFTHIHNDGWASGRKVGLRWGSAWSLMPMHHCHLIRQQGKYINRLCATYWTSITTLSTTPSEYTALIPHYLHDEIHLCFDGDICVCCQRTRRQLYPRIKLLWRDSPQQRCEHIYTCHTNYW